ncbi:hypothetical protein PFISCL1PPCAC_19610, partial [Pristionchus fissidentatus]
IGMDSTDETTRNRVESLPPQLTDLANQLRQQLPEPAIPSSIQADIHNLLYTSYGPNIDDAIQSIERATEMKRERITTVLIGVLVFCLVMGGTGARFVCNIIGIAYPAYASLKAVRSLNALEEKEWLVYWSVFGLVTLIDFWIDFVMQFFPFYYVVKSLFYLYLYLPYTRGADYIFLHQLEPLIFSMEHKVSVSLRESVISRSASVLHSSLYSSRPQSIASISDQIDNSVSQISVAQLATPEVKSEGTTTLKAEASPDVIVPPKEQRSKINSEVKKSGGLFKMWPFG